VLRQDGDLDWFSHTGFGHVGYHFLDDKLFPYVGVQGQYREVSVETQSRENVGFLVDRKVNQEFGWSGVQGVAGLEARIFGSLCPHLDPLFMRTEVAFGGDSVGLQVKFIYQFDLFD
jgi:hypothetical protein